MGNTNLTTNNLNVEDVSGDELSITSIKGEGPASDLSDSEFKPHMHLNQNTRHATGKKQVQHHNQQVQQQILDYSNLKRPTTPMDVRETDQQIQYQIQAYQQQQQQGQRLLRQTESATKGIRYHQMTDQNTVSIRFNEWDPHAKQQQILNERQKSPLRSKQSNSNFSQSLLNTDSSPRQLSGRGQITSANPKSLQTQQLLQHQLSTNSNLSNSDSNSMSNLDLTVSGQKLGRKDLSPTNNTPRDSNAISQIMQQQQQQQQQQQRPYTRRLQPLEKMNSEQAPGPNENQFIRQKTYA